MFRKFTHWLAFCVQSCPDLEDSDSCHVHAATCILFGDGTGAVVMTAQQGQCSLLGMDSHSDGSGQRHLNVTPLCLLFDPVL